MVGGRGGRGRGGGRGGDGRGGGGAHRSSPGSLSRGGPRSRLLPPGDTVMASHRHGPLEGVLAALVSDAGFATDGAAARDANYVAVQHLVTLTSNYADGFADFNGVVRILSTCRFAFARLFALPCWARRLGVHFVHHRVSFDAAAPLTVPQRVAWGFTGLFSPLRLLALLHEEQLDATKEWQRALSTNRVRALRRSAACVSPARGAPLSLDARVRTHTAPRRPPHSLAGR